MGNGMGKRLTACLLALCLTVTLLPGRSLAAEKETLTPNRDLLEAMLSGNRQWVIETLVDGSWKNNPMAIVRGAKNTPSLAKDALDYYNGLDEDTSTAQNLIYRNVVGAMYFGENILENLLSLLSTIEEGILSQSDAATLAQSMDLVRTQVGYDNLLKSVFTSSYTASDGTTLLEREASWTTLEELQKSVQYCSSLTSLLKTELDEPDAFSEPVQVTVTDEYINDYLIPYSDAASEVLENFAEVAGGKVEDYLPMIRKIVGNTSALALRRSVCPDQKDLENPGSGNTEARALYAKVFQEHLAATGILDMLETGENILDFADTALENYLFLEKIRAQRRILMDPLSRLSTFVSTDNPNLRNSLDHFVSLMEGEFSEAYGGFTDGVAYLRANRYAGKTAEAAIRHILETEYKLVQNKMSTKVISGAFNVLGISTWIADQAIGLKGICSKTYELLRCDDLTSAAVKLYQSDLQRYRNIQSEDAARVVLEDLMLLQRLRLYGEETAYALGTATDASWYQMVSTSMGNNPTMEQTMGVLHQRNIDILMAANPVPLLAGLTVNSGKKMVITYRDEVGDYVASCDGVYYVELPLRLAAGISGGGEIFFNVSGYDLGAGGIHVGSLHIIDGLLEAAELTQSGGVLELRGEGARLNCTDLLKLGSPDVQSNAGPVTLTTRDLELNGTVNCTVEVSGDAAGTGTLTGLTMNAPSDSQTVSGTFTAERLRLPGSNTVTVSGKVTASGSVCGPSVRLISGKNILLSGGTVEGGRWNGDLSVQNAALGNTLINGSLYDQGGTAYSGNTEVRNVLNYQGASRVDAGSTLSVNGAANLKSSLAGAGRLEVRGDLYAADGVTVEPALSFSGAAAQEAGGTFTAGSLRFANTGPGVRVLNTVTVTNTLENPTGAVRTVSPVQLGDEARLSGSFTGSLSLLNQTLPAGTSIGGDLTVRDGGTLTGGAASVGGRLIFGGAGTVDGCALTAGGLASPSSLTLQNGGSVTVRGDASLGGTLTNPTPVTVLGDLTLSGLTSSGSIRTKGDVIVSGTTSLNELTLDGNLVQQITGGNFTVGNLNIHNTSGRPLRLGQTVTVTGRYDNPATPVQGGAIQGGLGAPEGGVTESTVLHGGLTQSTPLTVTGTELVINGPVSVPGITLTGGARLTVNGSLTLTGAAPGSIDSESSLDVRGEMRSAASAAGTLTLEGAMDVRGDLLLGKSSLTGGGALTLGGDLYGAGVQTGRLTLNGLVRQRMGADSARTGDLTLSNATRGGVVFAKPLRYTGTLDRGGTVLAQENNLVKEAA